jgi:type VI secretion system protein ImpJ
LGRRSQYSPIPGAPASAGMKPFTRVVWQEGMHLAQHHFQLQSRYFEESVGFALGQLFFRPYGLAGCELDAEALRNGTVSVIHARGVLPDGLTFHIPEADPPPRPRAIRELFSPTQDRHVVLLAIPPYRAGRANCALEAKVADGNLRYVAEPHVVADETTGQDEKPVLLGRKNFRLLLDSELQDDSVAVPLARVRRDGAGHFVYDLDFIPPVLEIGASPGLLELLRRVIEILEAKSETLIGQRGAQTDLAAYAARDVASFWLAHTIHASLGPLHHFRESRRAHPEQLYVELARLAGALCTFSLDSHPRALPLYEHDDLATCFGELERVIRGHLDLVVPTNCIALPMEHARKFLYTGAVRDRRCLGPSTWILAVRGARVAQADLIAAVPKLVKVCSAQSIARLVKEAQAGLRLEHLPTPPASVAARAGTQYFLVQQAGPCWEAVLKAADIGIYVPEALAEAELELLVVLESTSSQRR